MEYQISALTDMPDDSLTLADLGGGAPGARPSYGPDSFVLTCKKFSKRSHLGVHGPTYEVHAPPYGKSWIRHCLKYNS